MQQNKLVWGIFTQWLFVSGKDLLLLKFATTIQICSWILNSLLCSFLCLFHRLLTFRMSVHPNLNTWSFLFSIPLVSGHPPSRPTGTLDIIHYSSLCAINQQDLLISSSQYFPFNLYYYCSLVEILTSLSWMDGCSNLLTSIPASNLFPFIPNHYRQSDGDRPSLTISPMKIPR